MLFGVFGAGEGSNGNNPMMDQNWSEMNGCEWFSLAWLLVRNEMTDSNVNNVF